eukprot:CAMPEP_0183497482 /NCGR_PEP_ID=MMETSP0370-20130417/185471_1 /TAXON_ID=268820 /ORGANISM="Peridinium aciculiferum, Strain PAER-2" /LENGTH=259 /DNA_ID=CAMNT_0025690829 /DNA_START=49 /DNA_END=826 /DNA_ORIENTATION=-
MCYTLCWTGLEHWRLNVVHVTLGLVLASNLLPLSVAGLLSLYLGAVSLVFFRPVAFHMDALWRVCSVSNLTVGVGGLFRGACCSRDGGSLTRLVNVAIPGLLLAAIAALCVKPWPVFFAEDVLPHSGPWSVVETAAEAAGVLCEAIELLSWEEAEAKARETVAQMTSAERHGLMLGVGWTALGWGIVMPKQGYYMGNTVPVPRLGIPALKLADAGNGFRNNIPPLGVAGTSTCWPSALAMASSWDESLVRRVAAAIGRE